MKIQIHLLLVALSFHCAASYGLKLRELQSVSVEAGTSFEYDLSKEVVESMTGTEFTLAEAPAWLRLEKDRIQGTPPSSSVGPTVIRFKARERKLTTPAEEGKLVLNVYVIPILPSELSLGEIEERKKVEFNLRSKTKHPALDTLAYRVSPRDETPTWVKLSADGILTGTPERAHADRNFDFRILVTSTYGGTAETRIRGRVKKVPIATRWVKKDFELPRGKEDVSYRAELNLPEWIENPEQARIKFRFLRPDAAWPEISSSGTLRGTPVRKDIGKKSFEIELEAVVDGQVFKDTAKVTVDTERVNKPPQWKAPLTQLSRAVSGQKYEYKELKDQVTDIDQDKLTFEILPGSGPEWLSVVDGTILRAEIRPQYMGTHRWKVRVSDGQLTADARIELVVENHAPVWKVAANGLPDALQSQAYNLDLKTVCEDPDHDALTFEATRLPAWLKLEGSKISGTAELEAVGDHKLRFRITDGQATTPLETTLKVTLKPYPPEPNLSALKFKIKERSDLKIQLNDPKFVKDPNNDTIVFRWEGKAPTWATLAENGTLLLQPQLPQVGIQYLPITLSDGKFSIPAKMEVEVLRDPRPSQWAEATLAFKSSAREPFSTTVGKQVRDLDSLPVKFFKKRGPSWLEVSPTGELTGTPPDSALGKNQFTVVADNGLVPAEKNVEIDVTFKNHAPEVFQKNLVFEMKERTVLDLDLSLPKYSQDIDIADVRRYNFEKPIDWIKLSPNGTASIAPTFAQIGKHAIGFNVTDGYEKTRGELQITIVRDARAPEWVKEEIPLETLSREPFKADLNKHVKDLDGLKITFVKRSGPEWFTLTPDGILSAEPTDEQVGDYNLKIQTSNDLKSSTARLNVKVTFKNTPPKWKQSVIPLANAQANKPYNQPFGKFADDIDKFQQLRFSKVSGPTWAIVDPSGTLFGTPSSGEVGKNAIPVLVIDGAGGTAAATLTLTVEGANSAPIANSSGPIQLPNAYQGELFLFNLAPLFRDAQGDTLTFRKVFGPNWIKVNKTGEITGVPGADSFGPYSAILEVSDGTSPTEIKAQGIVKQ